MPDKPDADIQADSVGKTTCPKCGHVMNLKGVAPFSVVECPKCGVKFGAPGKLGSFILFSALGKGEMGATYKALEKGLDRFVAIKVMRQVLGEDKQRVDDFFAEARAVASLEHPNAVRLYSVGQEKGQPYIVMELIKGKAMDKAFSSSAPMAEDRALEIAIGVAKALQAASEIGLVHGDVKPANIMLDEKGTPKLVDFGIAKFGGARGGEGGILGTPYYVAPEHVRRAPIDHRADMYSLGATLYHALAGSPPFPGTSVEEVLNARLARPAPNLLEARPGLHPRTAAVVARMLEADPDWRHDTYKGLLEELQQAYFQVTGLHTPELQEVVGRPAIPMAAPVRTSPAWLVGGGAAALVALAVVVWLIWFRGGAGGSGPPTTQQTSVSGPHVASPAFSPPVRAIAAPTSVSLRCDTAGAEVRFTLDGSDPTAASPLYRTPLYIQPGTTIRARAFCTGMQPSAIVEALYARDSTVLADVVPIRTAAEKAWLRVNTLNTGQGFGAKLEEGDTVYRSAEELYRQGAYMAAKQSYEKLMSLCEKLEALEDQRRSARSAANAANAARTAFEATGGRTGRNSPWRKSADAAQAAFDKGLFAEAERQWKAAKAQVEGQMGDLVEKARADWEKAFAKVDQEKVKAHGGRQWRDVERSLTDARQAEKQGQIAEAIRGYKDAIVLLPRAVNQANIASVTAGAAKHLGAARQLMRKGDYTEALAEVEKVLAIQKNNGDAQRLRTEINGKLDLQIDLGRNVKLALRWVPKGSFLMGSPDTERGHQPNEFQHKVEFARAFYVGKCEVTRKQYRAFKDADKYRSQAERDNWALELIRGQWTKTPDRRWDKPGFHQDDEHPVTCVTWADADKFCKWLSKKSKRTVRLPTEAEWEYACRAGTQTAFSFGDNEEDLHKYGNYADAAAAKIVRLADKRQKDGKETTARPREFQPNPWRLYDMHGNVGEWCADYFGAYATGPVKDPTGPDRGRNRAVRGGAWDRPPAQCRSAARWPLPEEYRAGNVGFRVVVEIN